MSREDEAARLQVEYWGERIARRRQELERGDGRPWSQQDLADVLGVGQQQVSKWENGMQEPRLATKYAIAEALATRADELFPMYP